MRAGRPQEAVAALKISIWSRDTAAAQTALADAYLRLKDLAAARTHVQKALALEPKSGRGLRLAQTDRGRAPVSPTGGRHATRKAADSNRFDRCGDCGRARAQPAPAVHTATVDGIIHPVSSDFMRSVIARADAEGAALVVFTLRTPGGLLDSTRDIINAMIAAKTPVAVFVGPSGNRAASAGFLITIAADVAAMSPGTHIGAAHPVAGSGEKIDDVMAKKMASDTAAYARTLATQRGRNVALVEQGVTESRSFTEQEASTATPRSSMSSPRTSRISSASSMAEACAGSTAAPSPCGSPNATVRHAEMTLAQQILSAIAHPQIAYLLLTLGTLGLTIELWSPGAVAPGVVGGICLLLAFFALQVLPVSYAGLLLILLGFALLVLEVKITSHGLLAAGGIASLLFGSLMLIDSPLPELQIGLRLILPLTLTLAGDPAVPGPPRDQGPGASPRSPGKAVCCRRSPQALTAIEPGGSRARLDPRRDLDGDVPGGRPRRRPRRRHRGQGAVAHGETPVGGCVCSNVPFLLIVVVVLVFYLLGSIKILNEYERAVVFRLGKLLDQPKGPGVVLVFAPIDRMARVSLRTIVMDVPSQDVITRDNVSVKVNAVVYFRVMDPRKAIVEVESYHYATSQLAQTTLRSVLGQVELDDLLSERERLNAQLQQILDQHTDPWGIKVSSVEVKHVDLPPDMQRAMAKQAEAEREKRAKIIHAAGELEASEKLAAAATAMAVEPMTITLRYLQTLTEIASEKNSTIIFPLPIELLNLLKPKA